MNFNGGTWYRIRELPLKTMAASDYIMALLMRVIRVYDCAVVVYKKVAGM